MIDGGHPISIKMHGRHQLLADAASYEATSREKHYPGMVERREISSAEAQQDLTAWRAIADLFEKGEGWGEGWNALVAAADRALASREQACAAKPGNAYLEQRRARVRWIRDTLVYFRSFYAQLRAPLPLYPMAPLEALA